MSDQPHFEVTIQQSPPFVVELAAQQGPPGAPGESGASSFEEISGELRDNANASVELTAIDNAIDGLNDRVEETELALDDKVDTGLFNETLAGKADFIRLTSNPSNDDIAAVPSSYRLTGNLNFGVGVIAVDITLNYVSENFWSGNSVPLQIEGGFWTLNLDGAIWTSNETAPDTAPENCTWSVPSPYSGDPVLDFTPAVPAVEKTTGQFALNETTNVMWQNVGDDTTPNWVALVKSGDLSVYATTTQLTNHTSATGNVHSLTGAQVRSILGVSTLSGSNTGDQDLSSYATTSAVAAGFVPRMTSVDNRLTRFDGTTGAVQSSGVTVDDANDVTGMRNLTVSTSVFVATGSNGCVISQNTFRPQWGQTYTIGTAFSTTNDNIDALRMRSAGVISFGNRVAMMSDSSDQMEVNNNTLGQYRDLLLRNLTASGTVSVGTRLNVPVGNVFAPSIGCLANGGQINFGSVLAPQGAANVSINPNGEIGPELYFERGSLTVIHSYTDNIWDLGSDARRFKNLFLRGNANIAGNLTASGTADFKLKTNAWYVDNNNFQRLYFFTSYDSYYKSPSSHVFRNSTDQDVVTISSAGNIIAIGTLSVGTYTVATLPSASANAGRLAQVTDSNSTTNGNTVAGGGSNRVPVFSNGTNWIIK